jgi:hypothetical protein
VALQTLVLKLSQKVGTHIRLSSLVREAGHHGAGRAVDIGNEDVAAQLLPLVATDTEVAALKIDEVIFDAAICGENDRNKWNYDRGRKHNYDSDTVGRHANHIHFSVRE